MSGEGVMSGHRIAYGFPFHNSIAIVVWMVVVQSLNDGQEVARGHSRALSNTSAERRMCRMRPIHL